MENETTPTAVRRRDLRRARKAQSRKFPTFAKFTSLSATPQTTSVAPAVRGSNGAALRALRRKRNVTLSAVGTFAVAGAAMTATLLSGVGASSSGQVTTEAAASSHAVSSESVSGGANGDDDILAGQNGAVGGVKADSKGDPRASSLSVKRTALPGCEGKVPEGEAQNGQLPEEWLCNLGIGDHKLRQDAAVAFAKMNAAYKADTGKDFELTDTYRTLDAQVSVAGRKPGLAAKPGTSLHGMGLAIDFGGGAAQASGPLYDWLVKHGHEYGWENPDWAKSSKYEPWHWEYVPGRQDVKGY